MRQQLELEKLVIKKGETESNAIVLHQDTIVLTAYSPRILDQTAYVQTAADGDDFRTLHHKGLAVKMAIPWAAYNLPIPACKKLRLSLANPAAQDYEFKALELMEI